jgi:hypothetical protein
MIPNYNLMIPNYNLIIRDISGTGYSILEEPKNNQNNALYQLFCMGVALARS